MATEILEDVGGTLLLDTQAPSTSTSVALFKPDSDTAFATGSASILGLSQALTGVDATAGTVVTVASAANFYRGLYYLDSAGGWEGHVRVAEVNIPNNTLLLSANPYGGTPEETDVIKSLRNSFAVTSTHAADRGLHYRAEWTTSETEDGATVTRKYQTTFHVVRMQFEAPITAEELFTEASFNYPGALVHWSPGMSEDIASAASDAVIEVLEGAGAYAHLVGNTRALKRAGKIAGRLELARSVGLAPPGVELLAYQEVTEAEMKRAVHNALRAMQWYDKDDSGTVDLNEVSSGYSVALRRS